MAAGDVMPSDSPSGRLFSVLGPTTLIYASIALLVLSMLLLGLSHRSSGSMSHTAYALSFLWWASGSGLLIVGVPFTVFFGAASVRKSFSLRSHLLAGLMSALLVLAWVAIQVVADAASGRLE